MRWMILFFLGLLMINSCTPAQKKVQTGSLEQYSEEELYNELLLRSRQEQQFEKADTTITLDTSLSLDTIPQPRLIELKKYNSTDIYKRLLAIYGKDDRCNFDDPKVPINVRRNAEKVGCLVKRDRIRRNVNGTYTLIPEGTYGRSYNLCGEERFLNEPVVSYGSGFAASRNQFVSAGHCIERADLSDFLIIYGYYVKDDVPNLTIRPQDVYQPVKLVVKELSPFEGGDDYAVITVDREFSPERIVKLRNQGTINVGDAVHVIGYPRGLPLKIAFEGSVLESPSNILFKINTDTYKGNSGSPVFNSRTNEVEGILIDGHNDYDFIPVDGCHRSSRCPVSMSGCKGEGVVRTSRFMQYIKR